MDLSTNSIIGWYGYNNGIWGYYNGTKTPDRTIFSPVRLLSKNNFIYAIAYPYNSNGNSRVYKFNSSNGNIIDSTLLIPVSSFYACCIDDDENIYISNNDNDSIKVYKNGYIRGFGGFGSTEGKLYLGSTNQVQVVGDTLIVADSGNERFQKFTRNGNYISKLNYEQANYMFFAYFNSKYYMPDVFNFSEFDVNGNKLRTWEVSRDNDFFISEVNQFVIVKNKIIFQDYSYKNRLVVFEISL